MPEDIFDSISNTIYTISVCHMTLSKPLSSGNFNKEIIIKSFNMQLRSMYHHKVIIQINMYKSANMKKMCVMLNTQFQ